MTHDLQNICHTKWWFKGYFIYFEAIHKKYLSYIGIIHFHHLSWIACLMSADRMKNIHYQTELKLFFFIFECSSINQNQLCIFLIICRCTVRELCHSPNSMNSMTVWALIQLSMLTKRQQSDFLCFKFQMQLHLAHTHKTMQALSIHMAQALVWTMCDSFSKN